MRIALLIQYDGSDYHGWQVQTDPLTVQGILEKALKKLFNTPCSLVGSGRTDSGVHALGQVAHFDITATSIPSRNIGFALNRMLPEAIQVVASCEVASDFHSRFQAVQRDYRYTIGLEQQILHRKSRWYVRYPLNLDLLHEAAKLVLGVRDFSSFCYAGTETKNMTCSIVGSTWTRTPDNTLIYRVSGDRFLHHMVRMLVGSMIEVARGKWILEHFESLLQNPDRKAHVITAPARGLALEKVSYPETLQPDWEQKAEIEKMNMNSLNLSRLSHHGK